MTKRLIIITGASSGIGEATARLFSSLGYPLLLLARRLERLEALDLPNTLCRKVDVTDRTALLRAVVEGEAKFGPVNAIINNAGLMLLGDMTQQDPDEWDRMLDVNVKGLLNGVHAVVKGMVERRHGTIINVSSTSGRKTYPGHVAYVGTKHAVHALSENLREEVAPHNVRVIVIAPGACDTELQTITTNDAVKAGFKEWKEEIGGVILAASEVAEAIRFAYEQPQKVCIREIVLASTNQPV